jgi:hypothetical protein
MGNTWEARQRKLGALYPSKKGRKPWLGSAPKSVLRLETGEAGPGVLGQSSRSNPLFGRRFRHGDNPWEMIFGHFLPACYPSIDG